VQSKVSECGWQEVLDQQLPVLVDANPRHVTKADITELKALGKPPANVKAVMEVICILLQAPVQKKDYWGAGQSLMSNPAAFMERILTYGNHIPAPVMARLAPYMSREDFTPDRLRRCSAASAGLCKWVCELYKYNVLSHASEAQQTLQYVSESGSQEVMAASVNTLRSQHISKADITELKCLSCPPAGVKLVMEVMCILLEVPPAQEADGSLDYWKAGKKLLGDMTFLDKILTFGNHMPAPVMTELAPYMSREDFTPEVLGKCSKACVGLCKWVQELYKKNASDASEAAWSCHTVAPELTKPKTY